MNDVTRILNAVEQGDSRATAELLPLVYDELRRIAAHKMAGESPGHTLQATALVHEAWLELERSVEEYSGFVLALHVDPKMDVFRRDQRFAALSPVEPPSRPSSRTAHAAKP